MANLDKSRLEDIAKSTPRSNKLEKSAPKKAPNVDLNHPDTSSIDNSLEEKPEAKEPSKFSIGDLVKSAFKFAPLAAFNFLGGGVSSLLCTASYATAYLMEKRKLKEKAKWGELKKEIYTGNIIGNIAYWAYLLPNYFTKFIDTSSVYGKIKKTLMFDLGLMGPFCAFYLGFTYLRDHVGLKKFFSGKEKKGEGGYFREAYEKGIKPKFFSTFFKTVPLWVTHYFSLNYIKSVPLRVGLGGVNDVLFRFFSVGKKKGEKAAKEAEPKPDYKNPGRDYSPSPQYQPQPA